jgi:hypothetical protein
LTLASEEKRMAKETFRGMPPEVRPKPACMYCIDERPCTWACLGTDSILAGSMWIAEELLVDFEQEAAEASAVTFVKKGLVDSFR